FAAQRIHQLAGAVGVDLDLACKAILANPAHRFPLLHARQFDNATERAEVFANLLVAVFVGHLHAAGIGGNADVIGNKYQKRIGIGILAVGFDGSNFFFVGAAAK